MSSKPLRRSPSQAPKAEPFLYGALSDGFWIIGAPLVALALMLGLWRWSGLSDLEIYAILFAFIVTGHHLPGWFRAFGEPAVYQRYRARLWVSLVAVPALVIVPTAFGLGAVALTVAALFDLWHVSMQQHGFGRIYAAKSGDRSRLSARLDLACVLTWYATAVVWSDPWMQGIARVFRKAGLPLFDLFSPSAWRVVKLALLMASLGLVVAYATLAWIRWRKEGIATPRKHVLHAIAFAVIIVSYQFPSWYRAQSVQNLFHALQYFFMVWIYGHLSIRSEQSRPARFYRILFGRTRGILVFIVAIAAYGLAAMALSASGYRLTGADAERRAQIIGSIGLASLLLHFYVDSFIWKVRSANVRATLGIREDARQEPIAQLREPPFRGIAHGLAYFGIPIALVAILGASSQTTPPWRKLRSLAHEADLFPRSAIAHAEYGRAALRSGDFRAARRELTAAVALAPTLEGPAQTLVELDRTEMKPEAELKDARLAVKAGPSDPAARYALGNALAKQRLLDEAEEQYRKAIALKPNFAGAEENLGVIYKWRSRLDLALPHFRKAHDLDPNLSAAACDLAGALATLGQTQEALDVLARYRRSNPQDRIAADLEEAIRRASRR